MKNNYYQTSKCCMCCAPVLYSSLNRHPVEKLICRKAECRRESRRRSQIARREKARLSAVYHAAKASIRKAARARKLPVAGGGKSRRPAPAKPVGTAVERRAKVGRSAFRFSRSAGKTK